MKYEIVNLQEKIVVGIAACTNNRAPNMKTVIGGLWNEFYNNGIYADILDKTNKKAIGLYTDYTGSEADDYTAMVCCEVNKEPEASLYEIRRIPAGQYAKFIVNGDTHRVVDEAWQKIWKMHLPRSFTCDFEEYQSNDRKQTEIHLYIGLRGEGHVV